MKWGSFGVVHIVSLILGAALIVGLYFILRRCKPKTQILILGLLSFSGIIGVSYDFFAWGSPFQYLPLHLCSLNAMVLPIAVFTRNKTLCNLLLLWSLGALMALVVNTVVAETTLFSPTFCVYYFPHVLEFGIPILMFKLGLVKKDVKCIISTLLITLGVYTAIHFTNLALNEYFIAQQVLNPAGELVQVNYMYSLWPENPVLELFWSINPNIYWYMMPVVGIVLVYLAFVYGKQLLALFKKKA